MIDAKEAVRIAMEHMRGFYEAEQIPGLTLEELELSRDESTWCVTLSFSQLVGKSPIEAMTGQGGGVTYKVIEIRAEDGLVRSMKVRQIGPG